MGHSDSTYTEAPKTVTVKKANSVISQGRRWSRGVSVMDRVAKASAPATKKIPVAMKKYQSLMSAPRL